MYSAAIGETVTESLFEDDEYDSPPPMDVNAERPASALVSREKFSHETIKWRNDKRATITSVMQKSPIASSIIA
jgi:hypothetical protein